MDPGISREKVLLFDYTSECTHVYACVMCFVLKWTFINKAISEWKNILFLNNFNIYKHESLIISILKFSIWFLSLKKASPARGSTVLINWPSDTTQFYVLTAIHVHCDYCLFLQTPPAIPTLCIVWMVCRLKGSKMLVDWHNYGYTLLALALGNDHTLVSISKR